MPFRAGHRITIESARLHMYVYIEQGTLVVDGRRTFDLIDVELSRRCTGRVDSSVQRVEDLLVVPSCQLLGAIIRKTHGEELYIIDTFPTDCA